MTTLSPGDDAPARETLLLVPPGAVQQAAPAPSEEEEALTVCTEFGERSSEAAAPVQDAPVPDEPPLSLQDRVRAAWDACLAAGETPSVRKIYAAVGGSYNEVTRILRALRQPSGVHAILPETPEEPASLAVVAAQQQVQDAEARLARLHATITQAQQTYADLETQIQQCERDALGGDGVAAERLPAVRRERLDAHFRIGDLEALLPDHEQAITTAQETLAVAQVDALRQQYNQLAQARPALWTAVEQALRSLEETLPPLLDATEQQRDLAQQLGIAYPHGRENPDRLLAWALYHRLQALVPVPPATLPPGEQPVLGETLAASDPACQQLSAELCGVLQAQGAVTWLRYIGTTGHAWSLEGVGLRKAVWRHPTPFTAAEVAKMRQDERFGVWVEMCDEPLWPADH